MTQRHVYDRELHAQFVTFSCYRRRRLLDEAWTKDLVVGTLADELRTQQGVCSGFVVMPDHVHALVWFSKPDHLGHFMKQWKQKSSVRLKKLIRGRLPHYASMYDPKDAFWQPRYYPFNVYSEKKALEKLDYMHLNPVRAGLAVSPCDWPWSSARFYELGVPVGLPIEWVF
ncbi:MAG: REP-associated tyrosine transposase [Pirellulales bacterium]